MKHLVFLFISIFIAATAYSNEKSKEVDICIYGGTSAGVIAAYTASKMGKSVLLIEPGQVVGGLSSGGLGQTDIGNKYVVRGLALDFYRKLGKHYGVFESWIFEPHVAENIFNGYLKKSNVKVIYNHLLLEVIKEGTNISELRFQSAKQLGIKALVVRAKVFMDCTYEGDLFAKAGVSYHVGREASAVYGESLNGVQLSLRHQFPDGVDPYLVKGDSTSGLIWGISKSVRVPNGTGDRKVQAYNYRIALTNVSKNIIPITKPDNYDPTHYELLRRQKEIQSWKALSDVFIWSLMPNGKTDINNRHGFSTDMIGMNWDYPEADYTRRKEIIKAHEDYTKGLLYFVGHDLSVPEFIRNEMLRWGYPKDEYVKHNHWSPQLYIREARRMIGELVMTQRHCEGKEVVKDEVGFAAYTMDSHNCDRIVVNGMVKNEGNVEVGGFPPFPISYRAIIPKRAEVTNLLVPVCLSASHIAFGSIRMEPVFMVLAQSAAIAACQAVDRNIAVQDVDVEQIKAVLVSNPKADGRNIDHLVLSSDVGKVVFEGNWKTGKSKGYGKTYLESDETGLAKFSFPKLPKGKYAVYIYYPKSDVSAKKFNYAIFNGKKRFESKLDLTTLDIKGQTSSTWVSGGFVEAFSTTDPVYVELNTDGANGKVAANAVILVPVDDQR